MLYYSFTLLLSVFCISLAIAIIFAASYACTYLLLGITENVVDFIRFWVYKEDSIKLLPPIDDEQKWQ